ncbi:hypothetical protein DRF68_10090 [Candidatus Chryseobacterium massiliae]|uniref:Uncharacterized protein n=1 Tax=Candidatus Chryseobacterium massiliense TaxID=204089 RepID=A0A3D9B946_9FLAO|nr:hypothetical protein DRF68_10090 [Candidatus Chryseobacterium massiliae]
MDNVRTANVFFIAFFYKLFIVFLEMKNLLYFFSMFLSLSKLLFNRKSHKRRTKLLFKADHYK